MVTNHWEHFEHGADIGIRGMGASLNEAFIQAALALTAVITDLRDVAQDKIVEIECKAPDRELLLVDWLNHIIYLMSTERMLFSRFEVHIQDGSLLGKAWGEPIDVTRHQPAVEVKGATFTELKVRQSEDGQWTAQCVVDV